jgi:hypothetical protein
MSAEEMSAEEESPELLLEMIEEAAGTHAPSRACANCGYSDPIACAMTCPNCDTRNGDLFVRSDEPD